MRCEFDCIETPLRLLFRRYAVFVARNPWPFVIVPLIFSGLCVFGFWFKVEEPRVIYLYTPTDARSKYEKQLSENLFPFINGKYSAELDGIDESTPIVTTFAADGGDILRRQLGKEVEALNKFILNIKIQDNGTEFGYSELCLRTTSNECWRNPTVAFVNGLRENFPRNLTFPQIFFGQKFFYIASSLGGVELKPGTNKIQSAKAWQMIYQLRYDNPIISARSHLWENEFTEQLGNYSSDLIVVRRFHSRTLDKELVKNADKILPKFTVTFSVLIGFAVLSTFSIIDGQPYIDWVMSKPVLAILGVVNAGLGVVAGIGFLNLCQFTFNDIVAVVPFLIVSICAEYMFLMIGAWRRTNRTQSVEERLGESVAIHAVSIVIAMGTGALSFAVGAITTIPAIKIFCIYCCVSMLFALLFQFTFFMGCLALYGKVEEHGRHNMLLVETIPATKDLCEIGLFKKMWMLGSRPDFSERESSKNYATSAVDAFFENIYSPFLMHPLTKILVGVIFVFYVVIGLHGCTQLRQGLKPKNLMVGESYASDYYDSMERFFWPYGSQFQVIFANASAVDMANHSGRMKILQIMEAFANAPHSTGIEGVTLFLFEYLDYLRSLRMLDVVAADPRKFYTILKDVFLESTAYADRRREIVWSKEDPYRVEAFRASVGLKNFGETQQQVDTMVTARSIASRYPELNITTYMYMWQFADQYLLVLPNTLENVAIALALMLLVSIVLIPHPLCSFCVALTIISIDIGVVGYMTLWDVSLDAISMITIIMSVGFSVDFTAHVSYGYVVLSNEDNPVRRMSITLGARAWPVTQACLATILGILALAGISSYMIVTFFKTVLLVMVFGLLHAIVFLPVLLDVLIRPIMACGAKSRDENSDQSEKVSSNSTSSSSSSFIERFGEPRGLFGHQTTTEPNKNGHFFGWFTKTVDKAWGTGKVDGEHQNRSCDV